MLYGSSSQWSDGFNASRIGFYLLMTSEQARYQGVAFVLPPEIFKTLYSTFDICRNFQIKIKFYTGWPKKMRTHILFDKKPIF